MVAVGALGPFFWKDAAPYLAVPTSVFAMVLLPIAYFAFLFLTNQESYLRPQFTSVRHDPKLVACAYCEHEIPSPLAHGEGE